tara:strand:- start:3975 stop:4124 length:150 start_codon:yes stop_codon:yes gene_type:complete
MNNEYEGSLDKFISNEIYLNVTHLTKGSYKLKIVHKSKVIKTINFKKDD